MRKILFLVIGMMIFYGCAAPPVVQPTAEEYEAVQKLRKTIAVVKISDVGSSIQGIEEAVTNKLESLFLTRFNVIERQQIEEVFGEREFQENIDVKASTEIGKILGADYIVIGSVVGTVGAPTVKSRDSMKDDKFHGSIWEELNSQALLDIKIIDVSNGSLYKTLSSKGYGAHKQNQMTFHSKEAYKLALKAHAVKEVISVFGNFKELEQNNENLVVRAIDNAVSKLGRPLAQTFVLEGQVLSIVSDKEVMINLGSAHGIRPGNHLTVWENQRKIIDPRTGVLVSPRSQIGKVEVAEVTSGLTAIAKGSRKVISIIRPGDRISVQY